jgi:serine/threonine-protein phosphatase 2A regulatory subunit B
LASVETVVACQPRRTFANAHAYHINSISVNSDGETFLSADDLRINLWNFAHGNQTFNIVDIKPENMEDLTEVITAAEFHPNHCSTFAYSNSRGAIKVGDMRASALCDRHVKAYEEEEQPGDKSFFSEIIASISDIKFTNDGNYIVARDYLSLKIWDVKMENRPVKTIQIHEHLRPKLCDLYENDSIFDKFECVVSPDGKYFATGSYHNYLHIFDRTGKNDALIEAVNPSQGRKLNGTKPKPVTDPANIDFSRKIMNLAWHPEQSVLAVCGANNLYLFSK